MDTKLLLLFTRFWAILFCLYNPFNCKIITSRLWTHNACAVAHFSPTLTSKIAVMPVSQLTLLSHVSQLINSRHLRSISRKKHSDRPSALPISNIISGSVFLFMSIIFLGWWPSGVGCLIFRASVSPNYFQWKKKYISRTLVSHFSFIQDN